MLCFTFLSSFTVLIPDSGLFPSLGWWLLRHNPSYPSNVNVEPFFMRMPRCGVWNGGLYCFQNPTVEPSFLKGPPRTRLLHSAPWQSGIAFLFYCFGLRRWGLNSESCVGKAGYLPLSCIPSSYCIFYKAIVIASLQEKLTHALGLKRVLSTGLYGDSGLWRILNVPCKI